MVAASPRGEFSLSPTRQTDGRWVQTQTEVSLGTDPETDRSSACPMKRIQNEEEQNPVQRKICLFVCFLKAFAS